MRTAPAGSRLSPVMIAEQNKRCSRGVGAESKPIPNRARCANSAATRTKDTARRTVLCSRNVLRSRERRESLHRSQIEDGDGITATAAL